MIGQKKSSNFEYAHVSCRAANGKEKKKKKKKDEALSSAGIHIPVKQNHQFLQFLGMNFLNQLFFPSSNDVHDCASSDTSS